MITNLKPDITPRAVGREARSGLESKIDSRKKPDSSFADQLLGAKGGELEGPDRTERDKSPGRGISKQADREGVRSAERDPKPDKESSNQREGESRAANRTKDRPAPRAALKSERSHEVDEKAASDNASVVPPQQTSFAKPIEKDDDVAIESTDLSAPPPASLENGLGKTPVEPKGAALTVQTKINDGATKLAPETEASSAKDEALAAILAGMQKVEQPSEEHAAAMTDFLAKMDSELGVSPDRVMAAFAKMTPQALAASPEESMKQFVGNLELPAKEDTRATEIYAQLLNATKTGADAETTGPDLSGSVRFEVMTQQEDGMRKLSQSLDELSDIFTQEMPTDDKAGMTPESTVSQNIMQAQRAVEQMDVALAKLVQARNDAKASGAGMKTEDEAIVMIAKGDADESGDDAKALGLGGSSVTASAFGSMIAGGASASAQGGSEGKSSQGDSSSKRGVVSDVKSGSVKSASAFESVAKTEMKAEAKAADVSGAVNTQAANSTETSNAVVAGPTPGTKPAAPIAGGTVAMMGQKATAQDEADNVRELVKQAQVVLRRGGGEMKLEMKPEGMGQVHLRVSVTDGQVNVQMVTDNEAAKSLLEKGLHELKATLADHQLHVDRLKVDVGHEIKNQLDQNGSQDSSRQNARQLAQDYMGSFREDRQQAREEMFGMPSVRSYGRPQNRAMVGPDDALSGRGVRASGAGEGSRRLNLVA